MASAPGWLRWLLLFIGAFVIAAVIRSELAAAVLLGGVTALLVQAWRSTKTRRAGWPRGVSTTFSIGVLGLAGLLGASTAFGALTSVGVIPRASDPPLTAGEPATSTPRPTPSPIAEPTPTPTPRPTPTPALGSAPTGETVEARVVEVVDGDTIKVDIDGAVYTVRYIGIDTPETVHPSEPVEAMGPEASAANAALVEGETVVLEKDVSETDQFDRLLRYVWIEEGDAWLLVNYELVRRGFAVSSTYPPDVRYQTLFARAERIARGASLGLWAATPSPTPSPTPQPTPLAAATPTPASASPAAVVVCGGNMDAPGNDNYAENLNGEYVVFCNDGGSAAILGGWRVHDNAANHTYHFPSFTLTAGASVTLYSGTGINSASALYWGITYGAVWNNDGDCAYLYNAGGSLVHSRCF